MWKRILLSLGVLLVLVLGAAALVPLLIPAQSIQPQGTAQAAATPDSRFVTIPFPGTPGIEVHYLERPGPAGSDGRAFLLLHGFTFNSFTWGEVLDPFATLGRTIAYDQIPYGLSAKLKGGDWTGANPYAKESAIAQVFAVMDALGVKRATLVGNSSGGTLALEAALARPDRVEALILAAPWVYAQRPTVPPTVADLPQLRRLSLFIGRQLGDPTLLGASYQDPARISAERRDMATIHTRMANWDLAWGALLHQSLSTPVNVSERLGQVRQPVLVITGDQDSLVKVADTQRVAQALPRATLAVLPDCGHAPQEECPAAFMGAVDPWVRGLASDHGVPERQ
ncbi:MAG TPA: alpha/beta hydrolase [Lamprocystis sp. (in: g-proteobacteria)]|nr:alpha/beta hydrolase [Lamprocystis sp. (in: g-proteobacteria)]